MAKINYTKVEEAIDRLFLEGLVKRLYNLAKIFEDFGSPVQTSEKKPPDKEAVIATLNQINEVITKIKKANAQAYKQLQIDKNRLRKMIQNPQEISNEDWQEIQTLRIRVMKLLIDLENEHVEKTDENLIEKEKKAHKNKRFNLRDKWWPV